MPLYYTAVALGFCNISPDMLRRVLAGSLEPSSFCVESLMDPAEEPPDYAVGKEMAEQLACELAATYQAPLCIGVMCVRFDSPKFKHTYLDIAVTVERGHLLSHETPLNPVSCKRTAAGRWLHETVFAREATATLVEHIRVRERSLLLEHFESP